MCWHKSNWTLTREFYVTKDAAIIVILPGPLVKWLSRCFVHGNKMEKDKLHFVRSTKSLCPSINVYYDRQIFCFSLSLSHRVIQHAFYSWTIMWLQFHKNRLTLKISMHIELHKTVEQDKIIVLKIKFKS